MKKQADSKQSILATVRAFRGPVNKSPIFNFQDRRDIIRVKRIVPHLDRIQLSVRRNDIFWKYLADLTAIFGKPEIKKVKENRFIYKFKYWNGKFQLIRYAHDSFVFSISISDPDDEIQIKLLDVLSPYLPSKRVLELISVSQVEFALDFYPDREADAPALRFHLSRLLYLKNSREDFYNEIISEDFTSLPDDKKYRKTTAYQGRKGDVRKGSKGLRCYITKKGFIRVEFQANTDVLKRLKIDISDIPIKANYIDIFDYLELRDVDENIIEKLADICFKKYYPNYPKNSDERAIARKAIRL